MAYQFKKFEGKNIRQENRITLTKSNQIGLPTQFYKDNGIKNFKYSTLFWDDGNKAIGIHFTNDREEKSCFSIVHSKKYGGSVVVGSFFKAYNIDPKIYHGRYEWEKHNLEGIGEIFVLRLKEKTEK